MRFEALDRLPGTLDLAVEPALWELYHANSKLSPETARREAERFAVSPQELFVASRGFKQFRNATSVELPSRQPPQRTLDAVLMGRRSSRALSAPVPLADLGTALRQALGPSAIVANEEHGVDQVLRTRPSAGGLYPLDAYLIAAAVEGLDAGVYHVNPIRQTLERMPLRDGDARAQLSAAYFGQDFAGEAAAALILVAAFDRTTAKYGDRGYRLVLLDAGHAAQNVLLSAEQLGLRAVAVAGYDDTALEQLLEIDGTGESVVHTILLGGPA
jgi:SagB-type dehydrogenase family enzyme